MTIGEIIQLARKNAGITQKELGRRIGVTGSMIGQWENNIRKPKRESLEKIEDALGDSFRDAALCLIEKSSTEINLKLDKMRLHDSIEAELRDVSIQIETKFQKQITDFIRSTDGRSIIDMYYNWLNDLGREETLKRIEELTHIDKYTEKE